MTFLITVPAVMVGCFLYDLVMNAYATHRIKRALAGARSSVEDALNMRLAELKGRDKNA